MMPCCWTYLTASNLSVFTRSVYSSERLLFIVCIIFTRPLSILVDYNRIESWNLIRNYYDYWFDHRVNIHPFTSYVKYAANIKKHFLIWMMVLTRRLKTRVYGKQRWTKTSAWTFSSNTTTSRILNNLIFTLTVEWKDRGDLKRNHVNPCDMHTFFDARRPMSKDLNRTKTYGTEATETV